MSEVVSLMAAGEVGVITIDHPPVNATSAAVRQGLLRCLEELEQDARLVAGVIACAGRTFVAGADIREFGRPPEPPRLDELLSRIERSGKPLVAALHGTALGGGLELALACHARVADPGARLGLPEVKLGLIPGAGGTQRLPRLVGLERAIDMILSGEPVTAAEAVATGLVDQIAEQELVTAAANLAVTLARAGSWRRTGALPVEPGDAARVDALAARLLRRSRGQHAPERALEALRAAVILPVAEGLQRERRLFEESRADPQSAALRHLFFAERSTGRTEGKAVVIERVAVLGAGTMGSGIAIALVDAGIEVALIDSDPASLERGEARIRDHYQGLVDRGRLVPAQHHARLAQLSASSDLQQAATADMVIEAVFEDPTVKRELFARLDAIASSSAWLATNTSYLDVDAIAAATARPERVLGLHFFSPANIMKLVEVVRARATSADALATGVALARKLGKIPVLVGNATGFVGNSMLQAYGRENQLLLLEGATPWQVDAALESWGMAMGPNAVLDLAGLDIGYRARRARSDLPDDPRFFRVADALVEQGRLGRKSGCGNYLYAPDGSRQPDPKVITLIEAEASRLGVARRSIDDAEIVERCVLALVNEGARLLEAGVAGAAADIDVIWANGYGFPRFRGGPMWFAAQRGLGEVVAAIQRLAEIHGPLYWTPAPLLMRMAQSGEALFS